MPALGMDTVRAADKEMLSFGQIAVQLTGTAKRSASLEPFLQKFAKRTVDLPINVVLNLEKKPLLFSAPNFTGWRLIRGENERQAVYFDGQKTAFSLQYGKKDYSVSVLVDSAAQSSLRLAVQFGLMVALYRNCIGLHGVTLLCGNEVVILSAPSGTGKTTLAHLLETYCDASVINGDFALLTPTENIAVFEPTPFCGTSGRCLNHRLRVNRVVFLEQSPVNQWRELTGREAMTRFMSNAFIPTWDEEMRKAVQDNILKCISAVKTDVFSFAPTREAAEMLINQLGNYED